MTSIREVLRRLLPHERDQEDVPTDLAYKVYWTPIVKEWSPERRQEARAAVERVVRTAGFVPNVFQRRYTIIEVDEIPHSGNSLLALLEVLESFANRHVGKE